MLVHLTPNVKPHEKKGQWQGGRPAGHPCFYAFLILFLVFYGNRRYIFFLGIPGDAGSLVRNGDEITSPSRRIDLGQICSISNHKIGEPVVCSAMNLHHLSKLRYQTSVSGECPVSHLD